MNCIDSSAWLEFLGDGPNAGHFSDAITRTDQLLVPAVCIYEVFRKILSVRTEGEALQVAAVMMQGKVVEMDERIAMSAARLGISHRLPFADAVILATASAHNAIIWTQDEHFRDIPGVRYFPHHSK